LTSDGKGGLRAGFEGWLKTLGAGLLWRVRR